MTYHVYINNYKQLDKAINVIRKKMAGKELTMTTLCRQYYTKHKQCESIVMAHDGASVSLCYYEDTYTEGLASIGRNNSIELKLNTIIKY
ncbi:MAG: hypothetical protein PHH29_17130 [Desulfuromonadaceae bacterium]|nr:hypothetical protein [Desulfuromonadaceae bacterium]